MGNYMIKKLKSTTYFADLKVMQYLMVRRAMKENITDNKVGGKNWAGKVLARLG